MCCEGAPLTVTGSSQLGRFVSHAYQCKARNSMIAPIVQVNVEQVRA
jgi:hypothetical protein